MILEVFCFNESCDGLMMMALTGFSSWSCFQFYFDVDSPDFRLGGADIVWLDR